MFEIWFVPRPGSNPTFMFQTRRGVNRERHTSIRVSSSDAFGQSNTFDQPRGIVNNWCACPWTCANNCRHITFIWPAGNDFGKFPWSAAFPPNPASYSPWNSCDSWSGRVEDEHRDVFANPTVWSVCPANALIFTVLRLAIHHVNDRLCIVRQTYNKCCKSVHVNQYIFLTAGNPRHHWWNCEWRPGDITISVMVENAAFLI